MAHRQLRQNKAKIAPKQVEISSVIDGIDSNWDHMCTYLKSLRDFNRKSFEKVSRNEKVLRKFQEVRASFEK